MKCCICNKDIEVKRHPDTGEVIWDQGNNADPVADGRCCDVCNSTEVIPARLRMTFGNRPDTGGIK
jgi:putative lipase involved disintegration of autophagic bodies